MNYLMNTKIKFQCNCKLPKGCGTNNTWQANVTTIMKGVTWLKWFGMGSMQITLTQRRMALKFHLSWSDTACSDIWVNMASETVAVKHSQFRLLVETKPEQTNGLYQFKFQHLLEWFNSFISSSSVSFSSAISTVSTSTVTTTRVRKGRNLRLNLNMTQWSIPIRSRRSSVG